VQQHPSDAQTRMPGIPSTILLHPDTLHGGSSAKSQARFAWWRIPWMHSWTGTCILTTKMRIELFRCIQDNPDNVTRFLVLAREPLVIVAPRPGTFKTTIVFSLMERCRRSVSRLLTWLSRS